MHGDIKCFSFSSLQQELGGKMTKERRNKIVSKKVKSLKKTYNKLGHKEFEEKTQNIIEELNNTSKQKRIYQCKLDDASRKIRNKFCSYETAEKLSAISLATTTSLSAIAGATIPGQDIGIYTILGAVASVPVGVSLINAYEQRTVAKIISHIKRKHYGHKLQKLEEEADIAKATIEQLSNLSTEKSDEEYTM